MGISKAYVGWEPMVNSIDIIHPNYIAQIWPLIDDMLNKCMKRSTGEITVEQMKAYLINGSYQLMLFIEDQKIVGTVILSWINYPNDRVMYANALAGKTTKEHANMMFEWAKNNGATCVRGSAQEEVARLWRMKYGFKTISYTVEKRL